MRFSCIYVEKEVLSHNVTKKILSRFSKVNIIEIDNYKHVFNRSYQSFQAQKLSPKLILAKKYENFVYKGSEVTNLTRHPNFFYNTLVLNCAYNCDYCYLQGMYNSSHIVVFVNIEDFLQEIKNYLSNGEEIYLSISYDNDILSFENWLGYCKIWLNFAKENPNLILEIRTKSNAFKYISDLPALPNAILAWTLSPQWIVKKYEKKTPTLNRRIESLLQATKLGWKTRICLDPVLFVKNWKTLYSEMIQAVFSHKELRKVHDITLGSFRMNAEYLKKIKNSRADSDILFYPFQRNNSILEYKTQHKEEIKNFLLKELTQFIPQEKIFFA